MKSPKNFYQTLNIICYDKEIKSYIPTLHCPMTNKSIYSHNSLFNEIYRYL